MPFMTSSRDFTLNVTSRYYVMLLRHESVAVNAVYMEPSVPLRVAVQRLFAVEAILYFVELERSICDG